ncbi:MAG: hypothetical protein V4664_03760, partial [Patescibacteria group bacterium]
NSLTGTTGIIDYTGFDVDASGNTDIGGTITAGSSNTALTLSTGKIDADALTLTVAADGGSGTSAGSGLIARSDGIGLLQGCSDGQILAWVESTDTWDCTTPGGGSQTPWAQNVDASNFILSNIGNAGTDFIASTGALTLAGILTANGGISIGTQALTGTTGIIDYTGFDVDTSGNLDVLGTIIAGSANTGVTLSTGKIDADALTLTAAADGGTGTSAGSGLIARSDGIGLLQGCTDGQVLKWVESTDTWDCSSDLSGSGTSKFVVKGTNENVASGTTLQSDNDLTFAVGSGETWIFDFVLRVTNVNSATPDWKSAILGAAGWTCSVTLSGTEPLAAAFPQVNGTDCDNAPTALANATILADASVPFQVNMRGSIVTNSTGSVTLQWAANTSGSLTVMAGSYVIAQKVGGSDLAEVYYTKDETAQPGDVMSLDSTIHAGVKKSEKSYDPQTIGIISTKPGLLLGDESSNFEGKQVYVALSGRVPVKVTTENGDIKAGDLLTSSSMPGVAMKATKAGQI